MSGEGIDLRPAAPRRFRVVDEQDAGPIPHTAANAQFKEVWRDARVAYVDMLETLGKIPVTKLLLGSNGNLMTKYDVKAIRDAAAKTADAANRMLALLDVTVDLTKRSVPDEP